MSKELVISSNRHETRVAIMEEDQLVEIYFQRANEYSLAGSVHKGRVTRVLPGMQSAFVDLGLERDTFLYVSDFFEDHGEDYDKVTGGAEERPAAAAPASAPAARTSDRPDRSEHRGERNDRNDRGGRGGHRNRHERPDRNQATQPVPPVAAEATAPVQEVDEPEAFVAAPVALVEGGAVAPANTVAAPTDANAAARAAREERDRKGGRRGRRRRGRGRGFPDSKYAPEGPVAQADGVQPEGEEEFEEVVEAASKEEVFVLPGESMAKYRHPSAPSHDVAAHELEDATEGLIEHHPHIEPEPAHVVHKPALFAPVPDTIITSEDPQEHPPANALPDAPIHPERVHEVLLEEVEPAHAFAAGGTHLPEAPEIFESVHGEHEATEPAIHAHAGIVDDEEDREIQEMIFEANDDEADAAQEAAESGLEVIPDATVAGEQGQPAEGAPLQAQIREGGRYMQRQGPAGGAGGRGRMRRGRGGDRDRRGGRDDQRRGPQEDAARPAAASPPTAATAVPVVVNAPVAIPRISGVPISITDLLKEGQEIIVQIAKEPLGQKGARITSHIALPGRYVVYMPTLDHMGVSRKIASDEERHRLKRILQNARGGITGGCIIRTAGEGKSEEELTADILFLHNLWLDIKQKAEKRPAPLLLHHDLDIVQRILRDQFNDNFKAVWVDNEEMYESVMRFVQRFQPALVSKIKLYTRPVPIFDAFNITMELEKALRPKIWLKSGGYIVINQTEALVAIDINTGKFVGKSNRLEDTIVKTNVEAVKEIVRQIRLRDLGGIIVIDFIDMDERKNRARVMAALEEAMRLDRAPYKILQFNDFGLVAITRKRVKQSLERALCAPCPYCEGAGSVKSVTTVLGEILQEAQKIAAAVDGSNVMLRCNPEVAKVLKSHHNQYLEELEEILKRPVLVKSDPAIHQEKFDLA